MNIEAARASAKYALTANIPRGPFFGGVSRSLFGLNIPVLVWVRFVKGSNCGVLVKHLWQSRGGLPSSPTSRFGSTRPCAHLSRESPLFAHEREEGAKKKSHRHPALRDRPDAIRSIMTSCGDPMALLPRLPLLTVPTVYLECRGAEGGPGGR